ncbi:hypothetical protein [Saccharopolyspora rosea]|uniref:Uncharacterized protein n=1 Tax=Saccharopolyspora rosea TaxID=524884 RepID=A0ABW3FWZ5_9PSEU|nr:hypothetical protein [Saccharopolyspora rosea]
MRSVRLDPGDSAPSAVGADVRAAVSAWGEGCSVLGGVAVLHCRPPGSPRPLDAVLVLPRGVVVVLGVDLAEPALAVDAPLRTPWTVDGWPLVRTEGAVNPGLDALESAAALARCLQSRGVEPMPVAAIVAVGPYAGQVTQPTTDLHRGVRVVSPSTTSILAAVRELATYERDCPVEPARLLLRALDERIELGVADLVAEGFPDAVSADLATADTMLIPKVREDEQRPVEAVPRRRIPPRAGLIAVVAAAVVGFVAVVALLVGGWPGVAPAAEVQRVDGVEFTQRGTATDPACVRHSYGDVRRWFEARPCGGVTRAVFDTAVAGRRAALAVSVVALPDGRSAQELRALADAAGTGGITDLVADGRRFQGAPRSFDDAAQAVQQDGARVRIVQAVWSQGASDPEDVELRALAERGLRLALRR